MKALLCWHVTNDKGRQTRAETTVAPIPGPLLLIPVDDVETVLRVDHDYEGWSVGRPQQQDQECETLELPW
jgi:hypothetical protein